LGGGILLLQAKEEAPELMAQKSKLEEEKIAKEKEVTEAWAAVEARLREVGNLVHDSVPVDNNEVRSAQRIGASRVLGFMRVFFF
jgi:seryl-tRNA synthetase